MIQPAPVARQRALADVAVQIVAQTANLALGVVVTALIARQLGTVSFGEWATILSVAALAGTFTDLKLQEVTIREIASDPARERYWLGAYTSLRAALALPAAALAAGILLVISPNPAMRVAGVVGAVNVLLAPLGVGNLVFRQRVRNHVNMVAVSVNSVLWAGAVVLVVVLDGGLVAFAICLTACNLITGLLLVVLARRHVTFTLHGSRTMWRPLLSAGAGVGLAAVLTLAYGRIDQIIVFELAPQRADAGLYAGIYRILSTAAFVPTAVMTTIFPMAAAAHRRDPARVRRLVQVAIDHLAMVSLPAFGFCLVAAGPLLALLLGPEFAQAAGGLRILMGAYVVICVGYVTGNMVIILGLQRRFINYALLGLAINLILNLVLVPLYGYIAAAWTTDITEVVVIGLSLRAVLRNIELRLALGRLLRTVIAASVLTGILFVLQSAQVGLGPLVAVTLVSWVPLLLLVRSLDLGELRQLFAERRVDTAG